LVNICKKLGADTYLSGVGARAYQDDSLFRHAGIEVVYQKFTVRPYPQLHGDFIPNLSALDYLLNCTVGDEPVFGPDKTAVLNDKGEGDVVL
jgi:hypothetical protein